MIALDFKRIIAKEVGIELHIPHKYDKALKIVAGLAHAILKHGYKMPSERKANLMKKISEHFGKEIKEEELKDIARTEIVPVDIKHINHGKFVVDQLVDLEAISVFVKRWRRHFVETMKPKFLPDFWDEYKPLESLVHEETKHYETTRKSKT